MVVGRDRDSQEKEAFQVQTCTAVEMKQVWLACILVWSFVMELQSHFLFKDFVSSYTLQGKARICESKKNKKAYYVPGKYCCTHKERKVPVAHMRWWNQGALIRHTLFKTI